MDVEGEPVLDLNIFLLGSIVVLILTIIGLLDDNYVWGVFPATGGIVGLYFSTALLADGSITELSGGTATVIAAASTTTTSAWQFISLVPIMFTLSAFLVAGYKVSKAF